MGKGRRERVLPLWKETATAIRAWISIRPKTSALELFLNGVGAPMTHRASRIFCAGTWSAPR